jgi:hypothetical protein
MSYFAVTQNLAARLAQFLNELHAGRAESPAADAKELLPRIGHDVAALILFVRVCAMVTGEMALHMVGAAAEEQAALGAAAAPGPVARALAAAGRVVEAFGGCSPAEVAGAGGALWSRLAADCAGRDLAGVAEAVSSRRHEAHDACAPCLAALEVRAALSAAQRAARIERLGADLFERVDDPY